MYVHSIYPNNQPGSLDTAISPVRPKVDPMYSLNLTGPGRFHQIFYYIHIYTMLSLGRGYTYMWCGDLTCFYPIQLEVRFAESLLFICWHAQGVTRAVFKHNRTF